MESLRCMLRVAALCIVSFALAGWICGVETDLGFVQPFVSTAEFYWDLATLPYHFWTNPCRCYECSSGYCLPGDPVPYLLYPPQISITGAMAEAGAIVGLLAIFP